MGIPEYIIAILVQLPLVGLFIWYGDKKDKEFQKFLKEQGDATREVLKALTILLEEHDKKTDKAIIRMEERTRPTGRRRSTKNTEE